jgi:hypothetical protein
LVSRRPANGEATHGLYRLDPRSGQAGLVYDDPEFHDFHARALVARPQPDGRSSVVNEEYPTGQLYCLNAYMTDSAGQPHQRAGMIRRLRVVEGVPTAVGAGSTRGPGPPPTGLAGWTANGMPPVMQKRLLGDVPVEEDGSFQIEVPADTPVQLQTLDEQGMALRSCGWIWVKHREPRGCIGCHEDPELTPENRFVQAVQRPAVKLTLPPDRRRTVDFRRDVMPIIQAKCSRCHDGGGRAPALTGELVGGFNRAYVDLLEREEGDGGEQSAVSGGQSALNRVVGKYVHPGQARTSPLIWRLYGRNTSRPWDASYDPQQRYAGHPPTEAEQLTEDEKATFVEWIDLGALWDGIPGADEFSTELSSRTGSEKRRIEN